MVVLQLLLALVVLLTSDGAQSQEDERCGYGVETQCGYKEGEEFCRHLEAAYRKNHEAIQLLKGRRYNKERKDLLANDCTLFLILETKGPRPLVLGLTVAALKNEVEDLIQLKESCNKSGWQFECFLAIIKVTQATLELVDAIKEIAEGFRPSIVKVVEEAKAEYLQRRNQSTIQRSIKLGESIETEIYNRSLIKPYQNSPEN